MKPFLLCLLLYFFASTSAQVPDNFTRITCAGEMPEDFRTAFSEKYKQDVKANQNETELRKKEVQEFAVLTNYHNHNLLTGGSALYGDIVSVYANELLDKLLAQKPQLREKLRVYTIKSNHVNAYSSNQGIIYITLGLVGKVKTEAQLAYVLAHEISHYTNQHVLHAFENQKEVWSRGGSYRDLNVEERRLSTYKYSRESEFEADKEALDYYLEAGYSSGDIYTGFDVLLHGYLPIAEQKYSWQYLENDSLKISSYYLIDSVASIKDNDAVDDELLTHPNIHKRKEAVTAELKIRDSSSENLQFVVKGRLEFQALQDQVHFEMVNTFIRSGNYVSALYHIQVLQRRFPDHFFLKRMELMSWYGMQKMSSNLQKTLYSTGYRKVVGEQQAVYYFASKMPKRGINILATKYIWESTHTMAKDSFVTTLRRQSLTHLANAVKKDFLVESYTYKFSSNVKKKRKPKKLDFLKIAFVELFKDSIFNAAYHKAYEEVEAERETEEEEYTTGSNQLSDSYVPGVSSYYGLSDVNKLLFLSPKFYRIDLRKELDKRLIASDKQATDLNERSNHLSALAGVDLISLDKPSAADKTTDAFNDFVLIRDWLREEALYEGVGFYSYASNYLDGIRQKYDTDYLGLNYVSHYTEKNQFNGTYFFLSVMSLYGIPFYLNWQIRPLHNLDYVFVVFDLKKGDVGFYDLKTFPAKYKRDVINSHMYNSFNQLNRER